MGYIVLILVFALGGASVYSSPLGKSRLKATHVNPEGGKFDLKKLFVWPNTYYENLYIDTLTTMKMAQAGYCMAMVGRTFTNTQYSNPWKAISNEKKNLHSKQDTIINIM